MLFRPPGCLVPPLVLSDIKRGILLIFGFVSPFGSLSFCFTYFGALCEGGCGLWLK